MVPSDLDREREEEEVVKKLKDCFKELDQDGNGMISKDELKHVLILLANHHQTLTEEEVDQCMREADANGNGVIEYTEFVEWLIRPATSLQYVNGKLERYDLDTVLRPLFNVYDRNNDGDLSIDEVDECHSILRNSLHLHADGQTDAVADPDVLLQESDAVFTAMDVNKDKRVSFDEFVNFQRTAIEKSGMKNSDIEEMVPELSRQLRRVFKMSEREEQGNNIDASEEEMLQQIIRDLATYSRELWNTKKLGRTSFLGPRYVNRWEEPPVGLNVNRLRGIHLRRFPCDMLSMDKIDIAVFCVPDCTKVAGEVTPWYAELVRKITFKNGKIVVSEPAYYQYDQLNWKPLPVDGDHQFSAAAEGLAPELRVFCLLKSEANFGMEISWPEIQAALETAVCRRFLTAEQQSDYNACMHDRMKESMRVEGHADLSCQEFEAEVLARLHSCFRVRPRHVMATLSELGIFKVSTVWADFMEDE